MSGTVLEEEICPGHAYFWYVWHRVANVTFFRAANPRRTSFRLFPPGNLGPRSSFRVQRAVTAKFEKLFFGGGSCPVKQHGFVVGLLVLTADGSTKPISEVGVGDEVKATDLVTGETADREVVATIVHDGEGDMIKPTVAGEDGTTDTVERSLDAWSDATPKVASSTSGIFNPASALPPPTAPRRRPLRALRVGVRPDG